MGLILHDLHPKLENFRDEVLLGLAKSPKSLPCKFFYDSKGSQLFNQICDLEEYYPTRTELAILQTYRQDICALVGKNSLIIEYGSGGSQKVRLLLNILDSPLAYLPIDISKDYLFADAQELSRDFPNLEIIALCADYTKSLILPPIHLNFAKKVVFFPGSTIGNLDYDEAKQLLVNTTNILNFNDALLIGVDLKKDPSILNNAYNDKKGVTAQFNLNLLTRINNSLQANFNLANFAHYAFYNQQKGRIEMHIISLVDQSIFIDDLEFRLQKNELIHTENSYKYDIQEFQLLAKEAGFTPTKVWTDPANLFSVHYLSLKK